MKFKIFLIAFILSLPFWWGINIAQKNLENYFYAQIAKPLEELTLVKIPAKPEKAKLELEAEAAISVKIDEAGNQKVLFKKNINQPLPIASLTKLMAAVIVLEDRNYDLENSLVIISEKAVNQGNVPVYGNLKIVGEKFSVKQLLELMLIYSSNDAAFALSEVIGTEKFIAKMNEKAEILGLKNSHFINPTGLDPKNLHLNDAAVINYFNHSTAKDLVKLAQYMLDNHPLIFEISVKQPFYLLEHGIFALFLPQEVIGGKTGFTKRVGDCLLFVFRDEKKNIFINVILGAEPEGARITEMQKLLNWLNI